ncbi:MAG TPA: transposase [Bacteroidales bacterium]|jgi:transposase|nr:transposase [Bacteroidales bacterium]
MKTTQKHPDWALKHKKPGTELKLINGRYYLYNVKSVYDKTIGRSKKISLGILGSITKEKGFIPSEKNELRKKSGKSYLEKQIMLFEYGLAKWLMDELENSGVMKSLKEHFPMHWKFIVWMVYCRIGYQSPLKNISFHLENSFILDMLEWHEKIYDAKISDYLFDLGHMGNSIHEFMRPKEKKRRTILIDATDIALQSNNITLSQKGYNSNMDFQPQFVLLYLYDALTLEPIYYRSIPGNVREVSAMKNTLIMSGLEDCIYISDKGFFSHSNLTQLESMSLQYIIPLRRDNKQIPYELLNEIEQSNNYFPYSKRFIFHTDTKNVGGRKIELFLDGKLREQEKTDYLSRIESLPESFSKVKFNEKVATMGTLAIIHNTTLTPQDIYVEYKNRGSIEQFFDHFKNTIEADCSYMQREESLNGWLFINHLSMLMIYKLFQILKTTPLNKKQNLIHHYSFHDAIEHLKTIKKIKFAPGEFVTSEINKSTRILLERMQISIT